MNTLRYSLTAGLLLPFTLVACNSLDSSEESEGANADALSGVDGTPGGSGSDCTFTQGYWKNHADAWPTATLVIGGVSYAEKDLLALLQMPTKGDASLILGHQLIAALLNGASGALAPPDVAKALADAEAWMTANKGSNKALPYGIKGGSAAAEAVSLSQTLDAFNQGTLGPGHCGDGAPSTGGGGMGGNTGGGGTTTSSSSGGGGTCASGLPVCGFNVDTLCPSGTTCLAGCCTAIPQ